MVNKIRYLWLIQAESYSWIKHNLFNVINLCDITSSYKSVQYYLVTDFKTQVLEKTKSELSSI